MFQFINIVGFASDARQTACHLKDTEFEEVFYLQTGDAEAEFKELVRTMVDIYSIRNMNIAHNLTLFYKYRINDAWLVGDDHNAIKNAIYELCPQYKDDIEKYLLLI